MINEKTNYLTILVLEGLRLVKFTQAMITMFIFFILVACNNEENVMDKVSEHIEATVEIEAAFEENQEKIYELEKEDEKIYNEIIGLGTEDYEKVVELSTEAMDLLEERMEYVKLEKESLDESRIEFEQIAPLIDKISDPEEKEQAEKMYETMINRYDAYEVVYGNYAESIELTKSLYSLFQQEEFKENEVYAVIANVNDSYDEVLKANETFNKETVLYNSLKEEYYEMVSE